MKSKNSKTEPPDAYWAARIMGSHQEGEIQSKMAIFDVQISYGGLKVSEFNQEFVSEI